MALPQRAENRLVLGRFQKVESVLKQLDEKKPFTNPFWQYRMGQALAYGDVESLRQAETYFQRAIDLEQARDKNSEFFGRLFPRKIQYSNSAWRFLCKGLL